MPGMTATSSSRTVKGARSCCSFGAALGTAPFLSTRFLAAASCCACADAHSSGGNAISVAQVISPMAKPEKMRSRCKALLRSLRQVAVRQDFSIRDYESSHQDPLVHAKAGTQPGFPLTREWVEFSAVRAQPRLALHTPAQAPLGPWPRQLPPPVLRDSRPEPTAYCGPLDTRTVTLPDGDTRPVRLTGPPPA